MGSRFRPMLAVLERHGSGVSMSSLQKQVQAFPCTHERDQENLVSIRLHVCHICLSQIDLYPQPWCTRTVVAGAAQAKPGNCEGSRAVT